MDKVTAEIQQEVLDPEWVSLMNVAREMGLSPEEIRIFINTTSNHK